MFQVLAFITAANLAMPKLPVEVWSIILRSLDPASLLVAVRTSSFWSNICKGDPVLRKTVRDELGVERRRYVEEHRNSRLWISISREQPAKMFGGTNTRKVVQYRPRTQIQAPPAGFSNINSRRNQGNSGLEANQKNGRMAQFRSMRC